MSAAKQRTTQQTTLTLPPKNGSQTNLMLIIHDMWRNVFIYKLVLINLKSVHFNELFILIISS